MNETATNVNEKPIVHVQNNSIVLSVNCGSECTACAETRDQSVHFECDINNACHE